MSNPLSPPPCKGALGADLPAYVSNGLVGLRVRDVPMRSGMAMVAGFCGEHPERHVEAAAAAPYPLFADIALDGVSLAGTGAGLTIIDQAYDFATGELTSRLRFKVGATTLAVTVLTFASRPDPAVVCQEIALECQGAAGDLRLRCGLDAAGIDGRAIAEFADIPQEPDAPFDGGLHWEAPGALSTCGIAYATTLEGAKAEPEAGPFVYEQLVTTYSFTLKPGTVCRLRQITAMVPSVTHKRPDEQAVRHLCQAAHEGFEALRAANRREWAELWKSRIVLVGAPERWQRLADAAFFYLMSSVHAGSPASTSMFGLAAWRDYHHYYGHVMWDIETFCVPVVTLVQPGAARSLLDFRRRTLTAAEDNARLHGRVGAQYPWEAGPASGQESSPLPGRAAWYEDHVSADVALAFIAYCRLTGDVVFRREKAWPVVAAVADWLCGRVRQTDRGFEIAKSMGVAERQSPVDNPAYMNLTAKLALLGALEMAADLGEPEGRQWRDVAERLVLPIAKGRLAAYDGFKPSDEKAETPDPLTALFPLGFELDGPLAAATLAEGLSRADDYVGSPMLSSLFGVWAGQAGDRKLAARLLDKGYARFEAGRFCQILEYGPEAFPEQPRAGPFFANMGGFLASLVFGFSGLQLGLGVPRTPPAGPAPKLPAGWRGIEVERLWINGLAHSLSVAEGRAAILKPAAERHDEG